MKNRKWTIISIVMLICLFPVFVFAYPGTAPNGSSSLIEIFPDKDYPALAEDISFSIEQESVDYVPTSAAEFDDINTVSLPDSEVRYIYGLQYLSTLEYLSLPGNLLTDKETDILSELTNLILLDISRNDISSTSLPYLSDLTIEYLNLSETKVTQKNLDLLPLTIADIDLSGNDIGDTGAAKIADRLPDLHDLILSDAKVGDAGAVAIAKLTKLKVLNLSGNDITDEGAIALSKIAGADEISLDLKDNHIGTTGMKALIAAEFADLELDNQAITADTIIAGRIPIIHGVLVDPESILIETISGKGTLKSDNDSVGILSTNYGQSIIWPARRSDAEFTYNFKYEGYNGQVSVPFQYKAIVYTVTFIDKAGGKTAVSVDDYTEVKAPADPVRKGYIFMGWYKDKSGNEYVDLPVRITSNLTLYAGWDKNVEDSGANKNISTPTDSDSNHGNLRSEQSHSPDTGDDFAAFYLVAIMMLLSMAGISIYIVLKRSASHFGISRFVNYATFSRIIASNSADSRVIQLFHAQKPRFL